MIAYSGTEATPMSVETATPPEIDDIFLHDAPLAKGRTFFPLGFPLELATNSDAVLAAAQQSWGRFEAAYPEHPVSLCITVMEHEDDRMPEAPKFRSHGHIMSIVSDPRNQVICDLERGCAFGWLSEQVVEDAGFFRFRFLESSVMTMLVGRYLAPIHSALITKNGVGIALCGESFAGKSTLAYACARSGWTFVSDDGTFLIRNRTDRFGVGNPFSIRFREDAKFLFPELESHRVGLRPNGQLGMEVSTAKLPVRVAGGTAINHVVFLRRARNCRASVNRFHSADALAWFERMAVYGPPEAQGAQGQAYKRLLEAEVWELHYSDLAEAVQMLDLLEVGA